MIRNFTISIFIFLLTSLNAFAQDTNSLDDTLKSIAADLSILQGEVEKAYQADKSSINFLSVQANTPFSVTVTKDGSKLMAGADKNTSTIKKAVRGDSYRVVDKVNDWYAVALMEPSSKIHTAWLNAANVTPNMELTSIDPNANQSIIEKMYEKIIQKVKLVKAKYENNSYVKVSGFSVGIGIPPSINISFEFKK